MTENQSKPESSATGTLPGGRLPDWEVHDLPAPPPYRFWAHIQEYPGAGNHCARRVDRQRRMAAGARDYGTVRREAVVDRDDCHLPPSVSQHGSHTLHRLYRRAHVERLHAMPAGIAVLGVLLFDYRLLRNLARVGDGGRHSGCRRMVGVYAGRR